MADIFQDFPIKAPIERVYRAVSTPEELDRWWTKRSAGAPVDGAEYELWFGPEYDWRAKVTRCVPDAEFELLIVRADPDWTGSYVGFRLESTYGPQWSTSTTRAGPARMPIIESPVTAGPSISEYSGAISNTMSSFPMRIACPGRWLHADRVHETREHP